MKNIVRSFHKTTGKSICCVALLILTLFSFNVRAQQDDNNSKPDKDFKNSISLGAFIVVGNIQVNYERLLGKRHGLTGELYVVPASDVSPTWWTAGVSYRYHFKPGLKGLFANAFYRHGNIHFSADFEENDVETTYEMESRLNLVGVGLGYRWQWKSGIAVVARAGCGYQIDPEYKWLPGNPPDEDKRSRIEKMQSVDLELSIGYSF